jgi:hypothetical protein
MSTLSQIKHMGGGGGGGGCNGVKQKKNLLSSCWVDS